MMLANFLIGCLVLVFFGIYSVVLVWLVAKVFGLEDKIRNAEYQKAWNEEWSTSEHD